MSPFIKRTLRNERYAQNLATRDNLYSHIDLLLHPRRPPFVRTLPFVESLSLSSAEESAEESATRHSLDLAFGHGEIRLNTSGLQNHPEPVSQSSLALDLQTPLDPPQERTWPTSVELHPQTRNDDNSDLPMKVATPSVLLEVSPPQAVPEAPAGPSLSISQKGPAPTVHVVPMVVDESDHEEVPTIDLDSDSDA